LPCGLSRTLTAFDRRRTPCIHTNTGGKQALSVVWSRWGQLVNLCQRDDARPDRHVQILLIIIRPSGRDLGSAAMSQLPSGKKYIWCAPTKGVRLGPGTTI
jgi:hypothetical protein